MNFHETYCIPGISVEEAWRVEDPISMARPCKNPCGVRSLVPTEVNEKCLGTTKCSGRFKSHSRTKCGGRCPKGI